MIVAQLFFRTLTRVVESRQCVHFNSSYFRNGTFVTRRKPSIFYQQRFLSESQPKDWIAFAKRSTLGKFVAGAVLCAISGIPVTYAYVTYVGSGNDCLEKGATSLSLLEGDSFIDRQELQKDLERMLTPTAPSTSKSYYLITGEVGIGKTAAIKHACRKIGSGVIYFEVPMSADRFAAALAEATGYKDRVSGSTDSWYPVYKKFKELAKLYRAKHDKQPVLVIDNVNILAEKNPEILETLQTGAKLGIDHGDFVMVFVIHDEMTPAHFRGRSDFSRGIEYRIGDINETEAFGYLQKRGLKDVDGTLYSKVFNLVGGRILLLQQISSALESGKSFEDAKNLLFTNIKFRISKCSKTHCEKAICKAVVECAIAKQEFSYEDVEQYLDSSGTMLTFNSGSHEEKIQAVMDKMVSLHLLSDGAGFSFTFHSMLVRSYFTEHPRFG